MKLASIRRFLLSLLVLLLMLNYTVFADEDSSPSLPRVAVQATECDKGLQATVESQVLKYCGVKLTQKEPTHRLTITCHWEGSPPHSTSFYSSWGNADLTAKVEYLPDEETLYAEAVTEGGKSRGLAMKKAAERIARELVRSGVFPKK